MLNFGAKYNGSPFFFAHTSYLLNDPLLYTCVVNKMGLYSLQVKQPMKLFHICSGENYVIELQWVFVYEISWEEKPTPNHMYARVPLQLPSSSF